MRQIVVTLILVGLIICVLMQDCGDLVDYKYYNNTVGATKNTRFREIDPDVIKQLYRMMYILDILFRKRKITYWMEAGTFLGAVRHNGIIPWDDDGDLQILDKDEHKLKDIEQDIKAYDLVMKDTWFGYKVHHKDAKLIDGFKWGYPAIDIFVITERPSDGEYIYKSPRAQSYFGKCTFNKKTMFPLERYQFGSYKLNGIAKKTARSYLNKCYGDDWDTHAYLQYDHENEKRLKRIKIELTDREREPAQPINFDR